MDIPKGAFAGGESMELRQIITFVTIIDQQSFSRAADVLGYTQAAVTIQIRQLEEEFHTRFFDRVGKHIKLTPPGQEFEAYAREILHQDEKAHKALTGSVSRGYALHIGTQESLLAYKLPALIRHFYIHFPDILLKVTTGTPQELSDMLDHNHIDMMYLLDHSLQDARWMKIMEIESPIVFVASAHSYLARAASVNLKELLALPLFLTEEGFSYRKALDNLFLSNQMEVRPFFETMNTDVIIRLISANQGVSFLPFFAVEESIKRGELALVNVEGVSMSMYRQMFYHKNKWVTEEMKEVIRLVQARQGNRTSG